MGRQSIIKLGNSTGFIKNGNNVATISMSARDTKDIGETKAITGYSDNKIGNKIKYWGSDNKLPNIRKSILMDNNIVGSMIESKSAIILGEGLRAYVEMYEGEGMKQKRVKVPVEMPKVIEDWLQMHDIHDQYLEPGANSLMMHNNLFAAMMPNRGGEIGSIKAYGCEYVRAMKEINEPVHGYLHHDDWLKPHSLEGEFKYIPKYDKNRTRKTLSIIHTGIGAFHDGVYWHPSYWGGKEWIELANAIPKFHKSNLSNGYTVRMHIEIPENYFLDQISYKNAMGNEKVQQECVDKAREAEQTFLDGVNDVLAGTDNAGRTILTTKAIDQITKQYEGISITPINVDMKDEALLKLFTASNSANISAMDLHPTLANVESAGKLSSGSEMKSAINIYTRFKTPRPRRALLKPIKEAMRRNGWDKLTDTNGHIIHLGFEDTVLVNMDEAPSGMKTEAEDITK